jgi:hypothetical protein
MGLFYSNEKMQVDKDVQLELAKIQLELAKIQADKDIKLAEIHNRSPNPEFPFKSKILDRFGCGSLTEQYGIYASFWSGSLPFIYYTRKYYVMEQYLKEPNPEMKIAWARKFPFDPAELDAGLLYLKRFGRTPRYWLLLTFTGPAYALMKGKELWKKKQETSKVQIENKKSIDSHSTIDSALLT